MKLHIVRPRVTSIVSVLCLVVAPYLRAQTTQQPSADTSTTTSTTTNNSTVTTSTTTNTNEEVVVLSPFVVDASADANNYRATSTLAGTRVRTDLKDVASAISVVTQQFLQDTGSKNSSDLLPYTPSTEVAGIRGNFSGVANTGTYQENTISNTTRVRGLDTADNTRDYFLTDIPWDGFNVGRVDLQRGPNSILFGIGSPAGIINTSINDAAFKTAYDVENRIGQYGSMRYSLDLNQELVKGVLAIRVAAVKDNELYEQKPAYNNSNRYYIALRFDPKLFSASSHTSIKAKYESGNISSNNPRSIPPDDAVTIWFKSGTDAYGHYGFNKFVVNQYNLASPTPWGTSAPGYAATMPGGKGGTLDNGLVLWNQTRSYWQDIINYYEDTPRSINNVINPAPYDSANSVGAGAALPTGNPIKTITSQIWTQKALGGAGLNGAFPAWLPLALPGYGGWYQTVGINNIAVPGGNTPIPGGGFYANVVLQDPSIFDFYKNLMDGPNKHEWQNWKAFNASIEQSFFDDRLAIQMAVDHQSFNSGTTGWFGGSYQINVDINVTYVDGSPNPNLGRPYVGNAASAPSLNYQNTIIRDTFRLTPTYEFRAEDLFGNSTLAKIIGKHVFTGVYETQQVVSSYNTWAEFAVDQSWSAANQPSGGPNHAVPPVGQLGQNRSYEWITYIGPSLMNKSSAAGANLQRINYVVEPPKQQTVTNFDTTWKYPSPDWNAVPANYETPANASLYTLMNGAKLVSWVAATGDTPAHPNYVSAATPPPGYVDPTAPYTFIRPSDGTTQNVDQRDNPANYVGWSQQSVSWMYASNPQDYPSLVESANRSRYRDISQGFTWQGFFLNGDLVPTFGWRKDIVSNYQTNAISDNTTGFTSLNFPDDPSSRRDIRGESKTWGAVYHLPKFITSHLPWDSTISVFFDKSQNFKADAGRLSMIGTPIPNSDGHTLEYGVTITTLQEKLQLKVDWFKTKVRNGTLADTQGNSIGGLGGNSYFIADGAIWGWAWATDLQEGLRGNVPNGSWLWDVAGPDGLPNNTPAERAAYSAYNHTGGSYTYLDTTGHSVTNHYVGSDNIVAAWLALPFPSTFFTSYNLSPTIDPTIARRTGYLIDGYVGGVGDYSGGVPNGGGSNFGNHQTTVDNLSKGIEVELTYQPVKNWNITLNYSKVKATHENIDTVSQGFIGMLTAFMNGPGGQVREWGAGSRTSLLGSQWNSSIVAPYTVELNELGHAAPEVSPWRLNMITTYSFDHGIAKGVFIGGALRVEAGRIIGYKYSSTVSNVNTTDPNYATNLIPGLTELTHGGLDVNQVFTGENEHHVDAWVGYSKKITRDINWRIQLNVRSVGEKDRLVASRINPDGSIALARIVQGMGWQITNTFDF
jgi:hypothetical protein